MTLNTDMKKALFFISLTAVLTFAGAPALRAQVDVPPVSDPVVVAVYCYHCGWIDYERGESHRADCPYVNGGGDGGYSSGGYTSRSSTPTIDPALSQAVSSMSYALGEAMVAGFDRGMTEYAAGSMTQYSGIRPGDQNGDYVVARNGRHGRVGMFDNDASNRWWKIGPVYRDLVIYDLQSVIAVKGKRVGVLDASGKRVTTVQPFKYRDFQILYQGSGNRLVYALAREDHGRTLWTIWRGNERLIADEFEDVRLTEDGIVAEVGDRYQVFDLEGRLRMIVVNNAR